MMDLLRDCLSDITATVRSQSAQSAAFGIMNGVPQGSALSPGLFVSTLGFAINTAEHALPTIHGEYADDIYNVVHHQDEITPVLRNNMNALQGIGLRLEPKKTELFHVSATGVEEVYTSKISTFPTRDLTFDNMFKKSSTTTLRYLGDHIGSCRQALNIRIQKANLVYCRFYNKLWCRNQVALKTKIRVFQACVMSTLLYALKCHALTSCHLRTLDHFCLRRLKSIFGFEYDAHVSYGRIDMLMNLFRIDWKWPSERIRSSRLDFFCTKLADPTFVALLTPKKEDKRKRGRPRFRLIDAIVEDLKIIADIQYDEFTLPFIVPGSHQRVYKVMWACKLYLEDKIAMAL